MTINPSLRFYFFLISSVAVNDPNNYLFISFISFEYFQASQLDNRLLINVVKYVSVMEMLELQFH